MTFLSVNIDHIATIREARRTNEPDPIAAAAICELAGAQGITVHLRGDRRHIQHRDVKILRETVTTKLNIEMAATEEMIGIELNAARYSDATLANRETKEGADVLAAVKQAAEFAHSKDMVVLAGHGLTYRNVRAIAAIPPIIELNIGHNIIARAALVGLERAVRDMVALL